MLTSIVSNHMSYRVLSQVERKAQKFLVDNKAPSAFSRNGAQYTSTTFSTYLIIHRPIHSSIPMNLYNHLSIHPLIPALTSHSISHTKPFYFSTLLCSPLLYSPLFNKTTQLFISTVSLNIYIYIYISPFLSLPSSFLFSPFSLFSFLLFPLSSYSPF